MDSNGGSTGGDVETTHHGIDIVDFTVDQRIGIIVFGELSLRTPVQKVAATAYQAIKVEKRYLFSFIQL